VFPHRALQYRCRPAFELSTNALRQPVRAQLPIRSPPLHATVLCTISFARYGSKPLSVKGTFRSVGTNPLILACAAGILLNLTGMELPAGTAGFVRALGTASLPLGTLCVGAALPTASSAYVMAPALGGDSSLMASTIAMQTIAGLLHLPGLLFLIASFAG
jgi:malonate transporter